MASNVYVQHYVDGTQKRIRRLKKQGRKALPDEFRRPCRVIASVSITMRERLDAELEIGVMKESDIVSHALMLWFEKYGNIEFTVQ